MVDALNPRQFMSLDYADADMYGALLERPATGVPLEKALPVLEVNRENASEIATQRRLYQEEWQRTEVERSARKQAEAAREQEITRREQAQRQLIANKIKGADIPDLQPPRSESPLAQIQRSTPERQPMPSTGSPPPTPSGTAARADSLVEPTALPRSAAIREAIGNTVGGIGQSLPKSLPQSAGRFLIPGVGAGLTFAGALIAGQSVQQAATTTAFVTGGSVAGGLIGTAVGGPIGGYVGSMVGGFVGGYLANAVFPQQMPSSTKHLEASTPNYVSFVGGQGVGVLYRIIYDSPNGNPALSAPLPGPITEISFIKKANLRWDVRVAYNGGTSVDVSSDIADEGTGAPKLVSITRADGLPDTAPDNRVNPLPPPDNSPYRYDSSPVGNDNVIPSGIPAAGKNKGESRDIAPSMPSNNTPNGARGFVGHGGLAPSYLPNPEHQPSNLGGMLPAIKNAPQPLPFAEPEDIAVPRITPMLSSGEASTTATNPSTFAYPAYVPETAKPVPISDALSAVPKAKSAPITKTPAELASDQQKKDFDEQIKRITAIATAIAALTPVIQGIPDAIAKSPTVQAANRETTQGAVCEISQPGGCLRNAIDDSANNINQNNNQNTANLLDKINAGANAAQLALLELMNTKLGDLIPGGISGKLQRLSSWMHLDRVLNILIWWQTLHNAYMLSANLGQTLTSAISNVLAAIGIKDAEGSPLDIGEVLGHQFDSLAKSVIGESEWGGIKAEYKKWNRIYQAAANLLNSIQSIGYSILSALEVVGSWVALIGNALRRWGEISEKAYRWMNPTPNFQNKFFTALETTENVVSQIDTVASEVLSVQDTVTQIGTQKTELLKALGQEPDGKQGTTPPEATQVKAGFDASKLVSATGLAISDEDKEADE